MNNNNPTNREANDMPEYLKRTPELFVRVGNRVIEAPAEDRMVAQHYPSWPHKGSLIDSKRLTILTKQTTYRPNEEIRVVHVVEYTAPGNDVYVMGPKPVYGEYVDGQLSTAMAPTIDPLVPQDYDGVTLESPAVDYNYEITTYTFALPGTHQIYWDLGTLRSNVLTLEIAPANAR